MIYNQGKIICLCVLICGSLRKSDDTSRALHCDASSDWLHRVGFILTVHGPHDSLQCILTEVFKSESGRVPGSIFASNSHGRGHNLPASYSKVFSFSLSPWKTFTSETWVCFRDKAAVVHSLEGLHHCTFYFHCIIPQGNNLSVGYN